MQEKSRASLTTGDTAVLTIAADISWVRYWRRFRTTSSVIGSSMPDLDDDAPEAVDRRPVAGRHEDRRIAPLDERRPDDRHAGEEALAIVDGHRRPPRGARQPRHARPAARRRRIGRPEASRRRRARRDAADADHPAVDEVDPRARGEGACDRRTEERPAATVAEQREAAGVEPALDQQPLHGERHLLVREPVDAPRCPLGIEAYGPAEPPERRHRTFAVEHEATAEEV